MRFNLYYYLFLTIFFSSCAVVPQRFGYKGPSIISKEEKEYYNYISKYKVSSDVLIQDEFRYSNRVIKLETDSGPIKLDLFISKNKSNKTSDKLILVFPILGGDIIIESYFAEYFAKHGYDSAVIHRDKDFKKIENFIKIEENFRNNVIRDRIALDYFQDHYQKKEFGSFGISRGAINAALTAGVDKRMKVNVLALGGSHIVDIFKKTKEKGVRKYRLKVQEAYGITEEEFYEKLTQQIRTDPANLAKHLDARDTMMLLSLLDSSVPFKYGMKLRREVGYPKTIFLLSGHYTSLLFTQFLPLLPPIDSIAIFPPPFIEGEALEFYNRRFDTGRVNLLHYPFQLIQIPIQLIFRIGNIVSDI